MFDEEDVIKKARNLILRYMTYRARSKSEAVHYLQKKGFSEDVIEKVIREMSKYGYLNDSKFTDDFISYRKSQGYGLKRIRYELRQKGIDKKLIDQKTEEHFSNDEDLARIEKILARRDNKKKVDREDKDRLFRREAAFLQRRGFQEHLIFTALKKKFQTDNQ
ncbi:MAG: regulatory protein RecX [Bacillota bacterium]|nr:regulatory protein RecX [Bacillota bacterium]